MNTVNSDHPLSICLRKLSPRLLLLAAILLGLPRLSAQPAPKPVIPVEEEVIELSSFMVLGTTSHEYLATNVQSATRLPVELKNVPFNVQVVTEEFMNDTMAFGGTPEMFLGAQREAVSWMGSVENRNVRGLPTFQFLRNGFLRYSDMGPSTIDRVEVIKGPSSALDGVTAPGGVINSITKKPVTGRDFVKARVLTGSPLDRYYMMLDVNHRLLYRKDGKPLLTGRLTLGMEKQNFEDIYRVRRLENIMPSLLLQMTDKTSIGGQFEYYYVNGERGNGNQGWGSTERVNDVTGLGLHGDVPLCIRYGIDPNAAWDGPECDTPEYVADTLINVQHRFTNNLVVSVDYNIHDRKKDWLQSTQTGISIIGGAPFYKRAWQKYWGGLEYVEGIRGSLAYKTNFLGGAHSFVAGFLRQHDTNHGQTDIYGNAAGQTYFDYFPILDPHPDLRVPVPATLLPQNRNENDNLTTSLYFSHHSKWFNERLSVLWGLYQGGLKLKNWQYSRPSMVLAKSSSYDITKLMPQVGVIGYVTKGIGVYANYSQSMQGTAGTYDGFDNPFGPMYGEIYEVGSKFDLFDGKANGTVSVFQIKEKDRIVNDPEAPNKNNPTADPNLPRGANVQRGELTSEGFDADLYFYPVKNFTSVLSYGFKQITITKDTKVANIGVLQNGIKHKVSVFNKYTFTNGRLKGLALNAGLQWFGKNKRTNDRFGAPAYAKAKWNAQVGMSYGWKWAKVKYQANFSIKNLYSLNFRTNGYIPGTRDAYYRDLPQEFLLSLDMEL